jgi:Tol biopolymer transport system component
MRAARLFRIFSIFALAFLALGTTHCNDSGNGNNNNNNNNGLALSVTVTGIGAGTVTSNVGNIQCTKSGGICTDNFDAGTTVTLTATPDAGFFFNGWLDACKGIAPCTLTLNQAESVRASFVNIAYSSNRDLDPTQNTVTNPETDNIWLTNSDGSHAQAVGGIVSTGGSINIGLPNFSPDGNQLVFISNRNLDGSATTNANNVRNVWMINADGSNPHPLAGLDVMIVGVLFNPPRWSPDGSQILFVSNRNINGTPTPNTNFTQNIWVVNADDTNLKVLAGLDVASIDNGLPVWSPDGKKIAFRSTRNIDLNPTVNPNSESNIWVMNADGGGLLPLTQITANSVSADWPQWSPDGSQIVFQSDRSLGSDPNGTFVNAINIWKMGADGSSPVALTQDTGSIGFIHNRNPQWSPDGRFITFESNQDPTNPSASGPGVGANNIWAVAADGSQPPFPLTALTDSAIFCIGPYWTPDASLVIFDSNRNHDPSVDAAVPAKNLWIVKPDGNGELPLTDLVDPASTNDAVDLD